MASSYTKVPRTIFWLVRAGTLHRPAGAPVEIGSFYIGKAPITNEQYEAFDPEYERRSASPEDRGPAVGITLDEARRYCAWYAEISRKPTRLPTADEWELACTGGRPGRWFWGDEAEAGDPFVEDAATATAGRLAAWEKTKPGPTGLHGMLGGVWEWTEDGGLRGGSFRSRREELDARKVRREAADLRADDVGFRIVRPFPR